MTSSDNKTGYGSFAKQFSNDRIGEAFKEPICKRKKQLQYERKVPHAAHNAKQLSTLMSDYIDKHKITNHTFLAKLEDPLPGTLARDYSSANAFNKDVMTAVLAIKSQAQEDLKAA
jgi:hypothetical protein